MGINSIVQSKTRNPRTPTVVNISIMLYSPGSVVVLSVVVVIDELETNIADATIISPAQDPE